MFREEWQSREAGAALAGMLLTLVVLIFVALSRADARAQYLDPPVSIDPEITVIEEPGATADAQEDAFKADMQAINKTGVQDRATNELFKRSSSSTDAQRASDMTILYGKLDNMARQIKLLQEACGK